MLLQTKLLYKSQLNQQLKHNTQTIRVPMQVWKELANQILTRDIKVAHCLLVIKSIAMHLYDPSLHPFGLKCFESNADIKLSTAMDKCLFGALYTLKQIRKIRPCFEAVLNKIWSKFQVKWDTQFSK